MITQTPLKSVRSINSSSKHTLCAFLSLSFCFHARCDTFVDQCELATTVIVSDVGGWGSYRSAIEVVTAQSLDVKGKSFILNTGLTLTADIIFPTPQLRLSPGDVVSFWLKSWSSDSPVWDPAKICVVATLESGAEVLLGEVVNPNPQVVSWFPAWKEVSFRSLSAYDVKNIKINVGPAIRRLSVDYFSVGSIRPPIPPQNHILPVSNVVNVSTSSQLQAALGLASASNIIIANGVYQHSASMTFTVPHKIYAATVGGAVLQFGLTFGGDSGSSGAEFHGLVFDVADINKTYQNSCLFIWGSRGKNVVVEDCVFNGNAIIGSGIHCVQPDGFVVLRSIARNLTSYGVYISDYPVQSNPDQSAYVSELFVSGVRSSSPGSSNGTAEGGIWLGNRGEIRQVRVTDCGIGIWTGSHCLDAIVEKFSVNQCTTGVYIENITRDSTFRDFFIGAQTQVGITSEWNVGNVDLGGDSNRIQLGTIYASSVGVYLDQGTKRTTLRSIRFKNCTWGNVGIYDSPTSYYDSDPSPSVRFEHYSP